MTVENKTVKALRMKSAGLVSSIGDPDCSI